MILLHIAAFVLGTVVAGFAVFSAIQTFILPRGASDPVVRVVFVILRSIFDSVVRRIETFEVRDRIMALYSPIALLALLPTWLIIVMIGYAAMFWAVEAESVFEAIRLSGSSLLTLGFAAEPDLSGSLLAFSEATIGLILVALLISFLPTMYSAFSRRETAVTLLEVRAGTPPSAIEMIKRFHRIHGLDRLSEQWRMWEAWFADIAESHTSLAAMVFFRSPRSEHSWVTAAGTVLDCAALVRSVVAVPADPQADLCLRAGYIALRHIGDYFGVEYDPDPKQTDPISITRDEFDYACQELEEAGVPLVADREQAWRDFNGWRVNYDIPLLALAGLTMAPYAPWSADRGLAFRVSVLPRQKK